MPVGAGKVAPRDRAPTSRPAAGGARHDHRHQPRAAARPAAPGVRRRPATTWSACRRPGPYVAELEAARHPPRPAAARDPVDGAAPRRRARSSSCAGVLRRCGPTSCTRTTRSPGWYGRLAARGAGVPARRQHGARPLRAARRPAREAGGRLRRSSGSRPRARDAELVQNPEDVETARAAAACPGAGCTCSATASTWPASTPTRVDAGRARRAARARWAPVPTTSSCGVVGRLVVGEGLPRGVRRGRGRLRAQRPERAVRAWSGPTDDDEGRRRRSPTSSTAPTRRGGDRVPRRARRRRRASTRRMDLYVLASHREGFPRSAMEAAAMGLPGRRHRHPRLPAGGRRRHHRPARAPSRRRPLAGDRGRAGRRSGPPRRAMGAAAHRRGRLRVRPAAA